MAGGLKTALDIQKPLVIDLLGQGTQTVLTLKITYVIRKQRKI
jgi:hypothetical protein